MTAASSSHRNQHGYTFIETLIILFIAGLIIGAFIIGGRIIKYNRVHRATQDIMLFASQQKAFFERYGRYAGDGNADGIIDFAKLDLAPIAFNDTPAPALLDGETADIDAALSELRFSRLLIGSSNVRLGSNPYRGATYFAHVGDSNAVVVTNLTCEAAMAVDERIDGAADPAAGTFIHVGAESGWESVCDTPTGRVNAVYLFTQPEKR